MPDFAVRLSPQDKVEKAVAKIVRMPVKYKFLKNSHQVELNRDTEFYEVDHV